MIFRGGRFSLAIKARRSWKIRVPMGGILHRNRGNTRRSLSTTRQENGERREQPVERGATSVVLCIEGHRSGSLGQLDNMYEYFSFHSGAQTLESYQVK
jgi:hypothetical protein